MLAALKRQLRRDNYRILTAESGDEALALLAENEVGVILTDQRMPGMTGTEFLARARQMHPRAVRMVLSGYTGLDSVTETINRGEVFKFLTKPCVERGAVAARGKVRSGCTFSCCVRAIRCPTPTVKWAISLPDGDGQGDSHHRSRVGGQVCGVTPA